MLAIFEKLLCCWPSLMSANTSSVEVSILCQGGQGGKSSLIEQEFKMVAGPVIGKEFKMVEGTGLG